MSSEDIWWKTIVGGKGTCPVAGCPWPLLGRQGGQCSWRREAVVGVRAERGWVPNHIGPCRVARTFYSE